MPVFNIHINKTIKNDNNDKILTHTNGDKYAKKGTNAKKNPNVFIDKHLYLYF